MMSEGNKEFGRNLREPTDGRQRQPTPRLGEARRVLTPMLAICLLAASGCTTGFRQWVDQGFKVGPDYLTPPAPVADQWMDAENQQINSSSPYGAGWWALFQDPVLDDLVRTASQENLQLQEASLRIQEARARLAIAHGGLFPQSQQAFGSYSRTQFSRTWARPSRVFFFDSWNIGFDAAWELDFWGRLRRQIEASEATFDATVDDYHDLLVILQAEVAAAYVRVRVAQERLELAERNVALQEQTLSLAELRFQEGATTRLDVTQARQNLGRTQALVPQLEAQLRESQNTLCVLLGMPPQHLESRLGTTRIPEAPREVAVGIPAELLVRRPDVRGAERKVAEQSARIGIAESDLYPRIAITGMIGYESRDLSKLLNTDSSMGSIGPGVRWNFLNYGRLKNRVRAEEARFEQLVRKYQHVVIEAHQEVENNIHRFLKEQQRAESLQQSAAAASESVELAQNQYREGEVDFQRLVDSERALVQLQDELTASRGAIAIHLVAIYKAMGGGWYTAGRDDLDTRHNAAQTTELETLDVRPAIENR